jgi:hypothetical protein
MDVPVPVATEARVVRTREAAGAYRRLTQRPMPAASGERASASTTYWRRFKVRLHTHTLSLSLSHTHTHTHTHTQTDTRIHKQPFSHPPPLACPLTHTLSVSVASAVAHRADGSRLQHPVVAKEYGPVTDVHVCPARPHDIAVTSAARVRTL